MWTGIDVKPAVLELSSRVEQCICALASFVPCVVIAASGRTRSVVVADEGKRAEPASRSRRWKGPSLPHGGEGGDDRLGPFHGGVPLLLFLGVAFSSERVSRSTRRLVRVVPV